jgi:CHAT domain-containing protein/tetratricopeptide (TPR) repeat protein
MYANQGRHDRAEPMLRRALDIREETLGPAHQLTAATMSHLATLYKNRGEFAKAEPLYIKVLSAVEKSIGRQGRGAWSSLDNLALIAGAKGDFEAAHDYSKRAQGISARLIDQIMGFTSEDQKLRFLALQRESLELFLGLAAFHMSGNREAARDALTVWLRRKGVILEAQQRYQEALVLSGDAQAMEVFRALAGVRSQLSRLVFSGRGLESPKAHRARVDVLEAREAELEARLSKLSEPFAREKRARRADPAQVASALPRDGVLVDFALVRPYDYKAFGTEERWGPAHYLAFVLPAGEPDDLTLVDLGEAGPIDREVVKLKSAVSGPDQSAGKKADEAGAELYRLVFAKLEKEIKTARQIFVAPDGNLNLLPFEVLRGPDGTFLIQKFSFNYLSSGRDLTRFGLDRGAAGPPLLMGDPDFDLDSKSKKQTMRTLGLEGPPFAARRSTETRGMRFSELPGTGEELAAVSSALGPSVEVYTGAAALEEVLLSQKKSPRILHLATHGFFLADQQIERSADRGLTPTGDAPLPRRIRIENPLLRSGLALAGANRVADSTGLEGGDGLLTAEEVLRLNLWGTDMVVLSACNTGVGEVQAGEGVYGLRRAFLQAGAEGLVMSMWPVPDRETKGLMETFYKHIGFGEMSRAEALRQAALEQLEVARERYGHPHPLFWGAFVYMGDPGLSES